MSRFALVLSLFVISIFSASQTLAQNTSGVFGPTVSANDHNFEYRVAADLDDGIQWAQRFHYERAISDNLRPRLIIATEETNGNEVELDFIRAELVWQITPDAQDYQAGMRFEGRVRTEGAEEVRANFINQWSLGDGWRARAIFLNTLQVADKSNDNLQFSTRLGFSKKLPSGVRAGVHGFFDLGDSGDFQVLTEQVDSELGPFVSFDILENTELYIGTLHGVTEASPDTQLRIFIERPF